MNNSSISTLPASDRKAVVFPTSDVPACHPPMFRVSHLLPAGREEKFARQLAGLAKALKEFSTEDRVGETIMTKLKQNKETPGCVYVVDDRYFAPAEFAYDPQAGLAWCDFTHGDTHDLVVAPRCDKDPFLSPKPTPIALIDTDRDFQRNGFSLGFSDRETFASGSGYSFKIYPAVIPG